MNIFMYFYSYCAAMCTAVSVIRFEVPHHAGLQTFTKSIHVYIYIFMYCYAYIVHSAACFKGRPILMTMSLAQSPTAIPVLSSVEQCVKFDSDCLTTGRHAVARDR